MIEIIITIVTFSSMVLLFKYFDMISIDNFQAITANYFTAGLLSLLNNPSNINFFEFENIPNPLFFVLSIVVGILFVFTFNLYAIGSQKIGITPSTIANKMSMIIPIIIGVSLLNENFSFNKLMGISLAFGAIILSSMGNGKLNINKSHILIIVLLFIGQGIADGILNWCQKFLINSQNMNLFFCFTFLSAGFTGLIILIFKNKKSKIKIEIKNVFWGIILGIPNYITLLFFIKSLKSEMFASSEIFPIINIGVIILCSVSSIIIFKEKVTIYNWIGVGLGILSIFVILN